MAEFINTKKEIAWGDWYFRNHVLSDDFNYRVHKKELSPYYQKRGFSVSMMYDDYFSRFTGVRSDRYMSMDLYYFYVLPCLNRFDFKNAYTDKNMYETLFRGVRQPETVVKCMNGLFFDSDGAGISRADAIRLVEAECGKCIIKPTIETCNGDGVALLRSDEVAEQFQQHGTDFICQRAVEQHAEMAKLNSSSLNTLRVFTYRDLDRRIRVLPGMTFVRVGGKGSVKDNGSSGGFLAGVADERGAIKGWCCKFKQSMPYALQECLGFAGFTIPAFEAVYPFVEALHVRVPYFDLIGWDVAIDVSGHPVFIEMNVEPSVEGPQLTQGVVFGSLLDEVMDRVSCVRKEKKLFSVSHFRPGFDYRLAII